MWLKYYDGDDDYWRPNEEPKPYIFSLPYKPK